MPRKLSRLVRLNKADEKVSDRLKQYGDCGCGSCRASVIDSVRRLLKIKEKK